MSTTFKNMAKLLYPKKFIKMTLIDDIKEIVYEHRLHYISFGLVCSGIEFLGKCLDPEQDWHKKGKSKQNFKKALQDLMPQYSPLGDKIYSGLRSGFAHGLIPGKEIGLTHRDEAKKFSIVHLEKVHTINVVIENFFDDFENACMKVLEMEFDPTDKMNKPLLQVPE